jgi:hypothetical protein
MNTAWLDRNRYVAQPYNLPPNYKPKNGKIIKEHFFPNYDSKFRRLYNLNQDTYSVDFPKLTHRYTINNMKPPLTSRDILKKIEKIIKHIEREGYYTDQDLYHITEIEKYMNDYLENMFIEIRTPDHRPSYTNTCANPNYEFFFQEQNNVRDYFQKIIKVLKEDLKQFPYRKDDFFDAFGPIQDREITSEEHERNMRELDELLETKGGTKRRKRNKRNSLKKKMKYYKNG